MKGRRAALVLVAVEKRGTTSGRVRMAMILDFKATTLTTFIKEQVAPGSTIYTDGLKQFTGLPSPASHMSRARNRCAARSARAPHRPCHWRTVRSAIFSNGSSEPTMASVARSSRSTWTSLHSGTTVAEHRRRPFRPCSASAPAARRPHITGFVAPKPWHSRDDRNMWWSAETTRYQIRHRTIFGQPSVPTEVLLTRRLVPSCESRPTRPANLRWLVHCSAACPP